MRLTRTEQASYATDGFLVRTAVFAGAEVELLRNAVERAAERAAKLAATGRTYILDGKRFVDIDHVTVQFEPEPGSETIRVVEPVHELDDELSRLLEDPRIVEPMRDLVGAEEIALWTNKLNLKRPREGSGFGWHQDSPYWIHDCNHVDQLPNVLVALDDATEDNGCFRVIRGSHQQGCLAGRDDGTQLGGFYTNPALFDESDQVPMIVPAGSLVFFNPHAVHGSFPNDSDRPRRALVLTYQPAGYPTLKSKQVHNVG
jgi:ectoine hydroxylase-related dioxygenase (phytanoyl-CoA dioxygenase family)